SSDGEPMTDTEAQAEEHAREPEPSQPFEPPVAEHHEDAVEPPPPEPAAAEPPPAEARVISRRRSTVREPAPISVAGEHDAAHDAAVPAPSEPPQPVVISPTDSEEADRPRRSGWWSRRVLGKD